MFRFFNVGKKQSHDDLPLLVQSTANFSGDARDSETAEHQTTLTAPKQKSASIADIIKLFMTHYENHNTNKTYFFHFIDKTIDLISLLSINRETYNLYKQNNPLIAFIASEKIFAQFKRDLLNELHKRERGPFDKLGAAAHSFNLLPLSIIIPIATTLIFAFTGLLIGILIYDSRYNDDLHPFVYHYYTTSYQTDVGPVTHTYRYQPELDTELQAKTNRDLAGIIGCSLAAGLIALTAAVIFMTYILKVGKLRNAFNSINNAEIKALENAIRTTILNITREQSQSPNYQAWMKHYIWNEKVNQPVAPFVPDDVEAQPALGM